MPNGVLPDGNIVDSEAYREWVNNFVTSTNHIEWIDHEVDGYSWLRSFIIKMREWEESQPNPVLRSQNVFLLIERIMTLRDMVVDEFYFEQNYQRLKIENALNHFYIIFFGFLLMSAFSIVAPLLALFYNIFNIYLAGINLIGFIVFTGLTIGLLIKSVKS